MVTRIQLLGLLHSLVGVAALLLTMSRRLRNARLV